MDKKLEVLRVLEVKLSRLLAYHRRNVFCPQPEGDRHWRAIQRLKRSATFLALCARNQAQAEYEMDRRLERQGY